MPRIISNCPDRIKEGDSQEEFNNLELRVLSPAFFARFVHYAHTSEAFDRECVFTDEKNRTVWLSRPELMYRLVKTSSPEQASTAASSMMQKLRLNIHKTLRCPPPSPAYPSSPGSMAVENIRKHSLSDLDRFVMEDMKPEDSNYRRLWAKLFLAQRLSFGFVPVVDVIDLAIRVSSTWWAMRRLGLAYDSLMGSVSVAAVHLWALCKS